MSNTVKIVYKMTSKTKATMANRIEQLNNVRQKIDLRMQTLTQLAKLRLSNPEKVSREKYRKMLNKVTSEIGRVKDFLLFHLQKTPRDGPQSEADKLAKDLLEHVYRCLDELQKARVPHVPPRESQANQPARAKRPVLPPDASLALHFM